MADEEKVLGSGEAAPQVEGKGDEGLSSTSQDGDKDKGDESQVKDADKLAKRVADLEGILSRTQSEKDKSVSQLAKATDALALLAEKSGQDNQAAVDRERQAALKEAEKRYAEGEMPLTELLEWTQAINAASGNTQNTELEQTLADAKADREQLRAMLKDVDPAYRSNKDKVDAVVTELGVDRETAMKIVAKYDSKPDQPDRPKAPGTVSGGVAGGGGDEISSKAMAVLDDIAAKYGGRKMTEAEKQGHSKKWSANK